MKSQMTEIATFICEDNTVKKVSFGEDIPHFQYVEINGKWYREWKSWNEKDSRETFFKVNVQRIGAGFTLELMECNMGVTFHKGGVIINGYPYPIEFKVTPSHATFLKGRGYMGGHVSQSGWDTDVEVSMMLEKLKEGYFVADQTEMGNVSGYYPEIAYWK